MIKARIKPTSERYTLWIRIFDTDTLPIQSIDPVTNPGPEGVPRQFYRLDVQSLRPKQRSRLIQHLGGRWKLTGDKVAKLIDDPAHGVPILADDVIVPKALPLSLFT